MSATSYKLTHLQGVIGYKRLNGHKDHRALDDVLVTVHLWNHLRDILRSNPVSQHKLGDLTYIQHIEKLSKSAVQKLLGTADSSGEGAGTDEDSVCEEDGANGGMVEGETPTPTTSRKRQLRSSTPSGNDDGNVR